MNKIITLCLAIVVLSGCSLTKKESGVFRDRGFDYEFEQKKGSKLKIPTGMELKDTSDMYEIPETSSDGESIMEPDMPVNIVEVPVDKVIETIN